LIRKNGSERNCTIFIKDFEEPYYGITMEVDCSDAYRQAKENGYSFFLYSLYLTLKAVNITEAFKYRIEGDGLYLYDVIDGSSISQYCPGSRSPASAIQDSSPNGIPFPRLRLENFSSAGTGGSFRFRYMCIMPWQTDCMWGNSSPAWNA
jgi:hypothetical protein